MASIIIVLDNYLKSYKNYFVIFLIVLLFILATIFSYYRFIKPRTSIEQLTMQDDIANLAGNVKNEATLFFFHVDWCPHCIKAQPIWDEFSKKYNKTKVNGYEITCVDVNCTDDNNKEIKDYISTYNIKSYPTVIMLKDGNQVEFQGRISDMTLKQFVDSVLQ